MTRFFMLINRLQYLNYHANNLMEKRPIRTAASPNMTFMLTFHAPRPYSPFCRYLKVSFLILKKTITHPSNYQVRYHY